MLPDLMSSLDFGRLTNQISQHASAHDHDGSFPLEAFAELDRLGLIKSPPTQRGQIADLLRLLVAIGEGDLSTGRIFEGHVNSVWLIETFGSQDTKTMARDALDRGAIFGVWNTDVPDCPLRLSHGQLSGRKNFASGVDGLTHAVVTVPEASGRRMLLVPLQDLPVDRSWWRPVGMRSSGSHVVDFAGVSIISTFPIGAVDDYIAQPWFSAGAIRFLAVQTGGMKAIFTIAVDHLRKSGRCSNPYQAHRLARMGAAVETAGLWLERCAAIWLRAEQSDSNDLFMRLTASVNGARGVIEALALEVLTDAEQSIGAAGMIAPHPYERVMRDLRTYLRQPNPDGATAAFGAAIADGLWSPNISGRQK